MEQSINKSDLHTKITELIEKQHSKMDLPTTTTQGMKDKSDGYLEALYQVEKLILNWGIDHEAINKVI